MATQKMFTREVVGSVTLVREDGKRHALTTGQLFDFTEEELKQIEAADPKALSATSIVNLDDANGDVDLTKQDVPQTPQQNMAPDAKSAAKPAVNKPAGGDL